MFKRQQREGHELNAAIWNAFGIDDTFEPSDEFSRRVIQWRPPAGAFAQSPHVDQLHHLAFHAARKLAILHIHAPEDAAWCFDVYQLQNTIHSPT